MTEQRRVYILVNGGHDYSDAERFGILHFLDVPLESKSDIAQIYAYLNQTLWDASPDDLLMVGSGTASMGCVATALLTEWFGKVNFLLYRRDKYEEHKLVLTQQGEGNDPTK